jgi:hypothetical protein
MAGRGRFELPRAFYTLLVFETSTFNHSVISPNAEAHYTPESERVKYSPSSRAVGIIPGERQKAMPPLTAE